MAHSPALSCHREITISIGSSAHKCLGFKLKTTSCAGPKI
jgi:hypothetical protein